MKTRGWLRRLGVLGVCTAACVWTGCASPGTSGPGATAGAPPDRSVPPDVLAAFGRAQALEREGQGDAALQIYLETLEKAPREERLYRGAIDRYLAAGKTEEALALARRLRREDPDSRTASRWIARILARQGRNDEAAAALRDALKQQPGEASIYTELVTVWVRAGRMAEARKVLEEGLARVKPPADLLGAAGELYLMSRLSPGSPEARPAAELLEQLRARIETAEQWLVLAAIEAAAGERDRAMAACRKALETDPGEPRVYLQTSQHLMEAGRGGEIVGLLESGLGRVRDREPLLRLLVGLYARRAVESGEPNRARADRMRAIECGLQVLKLKPDDIGIRINLADLHILTGEIGEAVAVLEPVAKDDVGLRRNLANRFVAVEGGATAALQALEELGRAPGAAPVVLHYLGELRLRTGDLKGARAAFEKATQSDVAEASPVLRLASLLAAGDYVTARRVLDVGIERMPEELTLLDYRARLDLYHRQAERSAEGFGLLARKVGERKDVLAFPAGLLVYRALAAQYAGRLDEALDFMRQAVELGDAALVAYVRLASAFEERYGGPASTHALFDRLEAARPAEARVPVYRGLYDHNNRRHAEAVAAFDRALARASPEEQQGAGGTNSVFNALFFFSHGSALERAGHHDRALVQLQRSLELSGGDPVTANYIAYMWAEKGTRLQEALGLVRQALEAQPRNPAFLDTLGWIYFKQGLWRDALAQLEAAAQLLRPEEDGTIHDHLGDTLDKMGRREDALKAWKRAYVVDATIAGLADKLRAAGVDPAALDEEARAYAAGVKEREARERMEQLLMDEAPDAAPDAGDDAGAAGEPPDQAQ